MNQKWVKLIDLIFGILIWYSQPKAPENSINILPGLQEVLLHICKQQKLHQSDVFPCKWCLRRTLINCFATSIYNKLRPCFSNLKVTENYFSRYPRLQDIERMIHLRKCDMILQCHINTFWDIKAQAIILLNTLETR